MEKILHLLGPLNDGQSANFGLHAVAQVFLHLVKIRREERRFAPKFAWKLFRCRLLGKQLPHCFLVLLKPAQRSEKIWNRSFFHMPEAEELRHLQRRDDLLQQLGQGSWERKPLGLTSCDSGVYVYTSRSCIEALWRFLVDVLSLVGFFSALFLGSLQNDCQPGCSSSCQCSKRIPGTANVLAASSDACDTQTVTPVRSR